MVLDISKSPLIGEMSAGQRGFIDITVFVCLVNLLNCYSDVIADLKSKQDIQISKIKNRVTALEDKQQYNTTRSRR